MIIKIFIYLTLLISLIVLFKPIKNSSNKNNKNNTTPLITFKDSTLYTIDDKKVTRIIKSTKLNKYKNKEEIIKGTLISRVKIENSEDLTDIIKADHISKIKNNLIFTKDVIYLRDSFISFKTNQLYYNLKTKIAKTKDKFDGKYYNNEIQGKNLYLNIEKEYIRLDNIILTIEAKIYKSISDNSNQTLDETSNKTSYFIIKSKKFESNMKENISIFQNNVKLIENNNTIKADKIIIYTENINNTKYITKYIVKDNIKFNIKTINRQYIGSSEKIEYDTNTKIYKFIGKTNIKELKENKELIGNEIIIDTKNNSSKIIGTKSKPISFTITPKSKKIKEKEKE